MASSLSASLGALPDLMSDAAVLFWFVVTIQVSHYIITALAKGWLGPRWNSWHRENHLHHIAASAYSWGWMRFLPWSTWRRVVHTVRRLERPMQTSVFAIEALAPLALLYPLVAVGMCLTWSCFHVGDTHVRLRDQEILAIPIDASCAETPRVRAPTPRMIDDLLVQHAKGKLIDLRDFGEGSFVQADDGKYRGEITPAG
jgi:hypothetical protein